MSLHTLSGDDITLSRSAIYSVAFLAFWLMSMLGGLLTLVLARGTQRIDPEAAARVTSER